METPNYLQDAAPGTEISAETLANIEADADNYFTRDMPGALMADRTAVIAFREQVVIVIFRSLIRSTIGEAFTVDSRDALDVATCHALYKELKRSDRGDYALGRSMLAAVPEWAATAAAAAAPGSTSGAKTIGPYLTRQPTLYLRLLEHLEEIGRLHTSPAAGVKLSTGSYRELREVLAEGAGGFRIAGVLIEEQPDLLDGEYVFELINRTLIKGADAAVTPLPPHLAKPAEDLLP